MLIERVRSIDAMHVHVDETRHNVTVRSLDDRGTRSVDTGMRFDGRNTPSVDQQRGVRKNLAWQDNIAAGEHDHGWTVSSPAQSTWT